MSVKYNNRFLPKLVFFLFLFMVLFLINGCGGGSGGSNIDPSSFSAFLATGKISYEGGTTEDTLSASVAGPGVSGGWIEDVAGNKLAGSDLTLENVTGKYETIVRRPAGGFPAGTYILKYFLNGQAYELKKENMQWTTAPEFFPAPAPPTYDANSRILTVRYQPISGSSVSYYLRIYSATTGSLYRETPRTYGPEISEYLSASGDFKVVLIAEVTENGAVTSTARHSFSQTLIRAAN
ncbi:MAG: hypothetical protein Kow0029_27620 [Candidatus Rifleibacteriota bacterium]